jgi:hypothetical protein
MQMYVFSHHVDLWRDLTLKLCQNQPCPFSSSWKDTYAHLHAHSHAKPPPPPHQPLLVTNFSSDLLYRSWVTREFNLEISCPGFMKYSNVDRRDVKELSPAEFVTQYESLNKPVVITGLVTQWKAYQTWDFDYFKTFYSKQIFRATSGTSSEPATFTMSQYEAYAHSSSHEEVPLYLFDRNFADPSSSLPSPATSPSLSDDYSVPEYFTYSSNASVPSHFTDLFSLLPSEMRPDHRWLIIGSHRSGSIFHIDPNQTHAWNACLKGRKKWIFYPPTTTPPGIFVTPDGGDVTVPLSTGEWLLSFWKYHLQNRSPTQDSPSPSSPHPLEVIVNPGELIFVPHGWWHMVINLDEESMALTQNYVSSTNLIDCYEFLKEKSDQISGLRGEEYNSNQFRQDFHQRFEEILSTHHPDLADFMRRGYQERRERRERRERGERGERRRIQRVKMNDAVAAADAIYEKEEEGNRNRKRKSKLAEVFCLNQKNPPMPLTELAPETYPLTGQQRKRSSSNWSNENGNSCEDPLHEEDLPLEKKEKASGFPDSSRWGSSSTTSCSVNSTFSFSFNL